MQADAWRSARAKPKADAAPCQAADAIAWKALDGTRRILEDSTVDRDDIIRSMAKLVVRGGRARALIFDEQKLREICRRQGLPELGATAC